MKPRMRTLLVAAGALFAAACAGEVVTEGDSDSIGDELRASCNDGNACTIDGAAPRKQCTHTPAANGTPCPGGTCVSASCVATPAPPDMAESTDGALAPPAPDLAQPAPDLAQPAPDLAQPAPTNGGIDCTNAASWPSTWASYEDQVLTLVNQRRAAGATCGSTAYPPAAPITMNAQLRQAARCHSLDMATRGYFSHYTPEGGTPWDRIAAAGYAGSRLGENIAAGYGDPSSVVSGWMSSPGHCGNIMGAEYAETGVGYAFKSGSPYGSYWTETFGRR